MRLGGICHSVDCDSESSASFESTSEFAVWPLQTRRLAAELLRAAWQPQATSDPLRLGTSIVTCSYIIHGEIMYCNYCGKLIQDDANLCAYCGTRVGYVAARKKLMRLRSDRKIAGVCSGFAEYFDLDVTMVRVVWLIVAFFGGGGILAYIIAWIVIPEEPETMAAAPSSDVQPYQGS